MRRLTMGLAILLLGSVAFYGFYLARLSYSGYCFNQKRYLSDDEFIQAAIRSQLQNINIDGSENSIATFREKNSKCCSLSREPNGMSLVNVVLNHAYIDVTLRYEKKMTALFQKEEPFYQSIVSIQSCGTVLKTVGSGARAADGPF